MLVQLMEEGSCSPQSGSTSTLELLPSIISHYGYLGYYILINMYRYI